MMDKLIIGNETKVTGQYFHLRIEDIWFTLVLNEPENKISLQQAFKEKAHKCLKPKLRNYLQNRFKRFQINQEDLNYQSSVWRNEPTSDSVKFQFSIGLFNLQKRERVSILVVSSDRSISSVTLSKS
ncbi:hypothetical protein Avbf_16854 [Armadillidium vulgare]|nr:hypothetical protein Avbf_16854 [Armadillidium vulgare]